MILTLIAVVLMFLILNFLLPQDLSATIDRIKNSSAGMAGKLDFIGLMFPFAVGLIVACWLFRWLHKRSYNAFVEEFKAELERLRRQSASQEHQTQKELGQVNRAISRCLQFITEGDGDPGAVRSELQNSSGANKSWSAPWHQRRRAGLSSCFLTLPSSSVAR